MELQDELMRQYVCKHLQKGGIFSEFQLKIRQSNSTVIHWLAWVKSESQIRCRAQEERHPRLPANSSSICVLDKKVTQPHRRDNKIVTENIA